jgi:hypothetical protein
MKSSVPRARLAVSAVVTAGLCLAGTAALATPSQAAMGTCDPAYPVSDITADQPVSGLTVSSGTTPSPFTGSVIGVITDGIEPGVDLIMARLTSTDIDAAGIWEGMSGSPVYAEDGSLIGAVSYTLAWGQTPVAGITPWEDMQQYAGTPAPLNVRVPAAAAKAIAGRSSVTTAQASQGFHELKAPALVAGLSQRALDKAKARPYLSKDVAAAGHAAGASSPDDMVSGGNLVATLSTGDITMGGLGTITSVCNGRLVGFGHPMNFAGRTTYGLAGADALYVQTDPVGPSFKVANIGSVLGTVDQDRMTGISGQLGTTPPDLPITSTVDYQDGSATHSRTGESHVQLPDAAAEATFYELVANHQAVIDASQPGSEEQSWTVTGTSAGGPFTFTSSNLYSDKYDIAYGSSYDVPDLVWALSKLKSVTIDSVDVHSTVRDDTARLRIAGVQQRRGGAWVDVNRHHQAVVEAGTSATMRLVFKNGDTGKKFRIEIPKKARGLHAELFVSGGNQYPFERGGLGTFAGIQKAVDNLVRNDQARVQFAAFGKRQLVRSSTATPPTGEVLSGSAYFAAKVL